MVCKKTYFLLHLVLFQDSHIFRRIRTATLYIRIHAVVLSPDVILIWGFHRGAILFSRAEAYRHFGGKYCNYLQGKRLNSVCSFLAWLTFRYWTWKHHVLRNVNGLSPDYMELYPRIQHSSNYWLINRYHRIKFANVSFVRHVSVSQITFRGILYC